MVEQALTCYNHPGVKTSLRCNKCERPICIRCARQTPVGYRCAECLRGQQAVFDTAHGYDHAITAVIAALGVGAATYLLGYLGAWGLLLAPVLGTMLAGLIRIAVRRRRSSRLPIAAVIGGIMGVMLNIGVASIGLLVVLRQSYSAAYVLPQALTILWPLASGIVMVVVVYYRMKGNRV